MRALSAASLDPARAAGTGREGEGGEEALPLTCMHACGHLRCHMAACNNRPCSTAGGRDGGRREGREAGLGQVGTIRVRPYINILGSLC